MVIQLTNCSIRQPANILDDVPIQVGKFFIPCDFIFLNMDESSQVPIILGRLFLATIGAVIDVQASTMSFQLCKDRVDFYLPPPTPSSMPVISPSPAATEPIAPLVASPETMAFDADGGPHIHHPAPSDPPQPIPTSLGMAFAYTREIMATTPHL